MLHFAWKAGPAADVSGAVFVSATRFTYRRLWHMPFVFWHGLKLRQGWEKIEGAVGVSLSADLLRHTTYTLSVWKQETCLLRWLRSPYHAQLMRAYRSRLESSAAASWQTDHFMLREAWKEALQRLAPVAVR